MSRVCLLLLINKIEASIKTSSFSVDCRQSMELHSGASYFTSDMFAHICKSLLIPGQSLRDIFRNGPLSPI